MNEKHVKNKTLLTIQANILHRNATNDANKHRKSLGQYLLNGLKSSVMETHEHKHKLLAYMSNLHADIAQIQMQLQQLQRERLSLKQKLKQNNSQNGNRVRKLSRSLLDAREINCRLAQRLIAKRTCTETARCSLEAAKQENTRMRDEINILFEMLTKRDEMTCEMFEQMLRLKQNRDLKQLEMERSEVMHRQTLDSLINKLRQLAQDNVELQELYEESYKKQTDGRCGQHSTRHSDLLEQVSRRVHAQAENSDLLWQQHRLRHENMMLRLENNALLDDLRESCGVHGRSQAHDEYKHVFVVSSDEDLERNVPLNRQTIDDNSEPKVVIRELDSP